MPVNEHIIQLRGKATIDRPLKSDTDYVVTGRVSLSQTKIHPNGDGSDDVTYVVEPTEFSIQNESGATLNLKKKSTLSQAMRMQVVMWARDNFPDWEDDEGYEKVMRKILDKLPNILTILKKDLE